MDVYRKKSSSFRGKLSILWGKLVRVPKWRQIDEVGLALFAAFIIATTLFYFNQWQLNEEDWKRAPGSRHEIVDDLIDSNILSSKSKQEVITVLGEPYPYVNRNSDTLVYNLGKPPSFFEETQERLQITFEKGIVKSVSVETK